jgi:uncharacterized damage-inducible protein DinB
MDEFQFLHEQFENIYRGPGESWHGPNMIQLLDGVSAERAKIRPISGRHNIWEIVKHVNYWMLATLTGLKGENVPRPQELEDWPKIGETEENWEATVKELNDTVGKFLNTLSGLSPSRLEEKVPNRNYNYRILLHGVLHHNLYHMGQIAILR